MKTHKPIGLLVIVILLMGTLPTLADEKEVEALTPLGTAPGSAVSSAPEALWPGPDGYGYFGSIVTYSWVEISGSGTPVYLTDDDWDGPFPIGFAFSFYGVPWTDFYISSNGFLSFGAGSTSLTNQCPLPSATAPDNLIALMWDDLDPGDTSDPAYYQTFDPCPVGSGACLVVQYEDYCHYPGGPSCSIAGTFEAILYANGEVVLQYEDSGAELGSGSTTGIEGANAAADYGLTYACDTPNSITDGLAIKFGFPEGVFLMPESQSGQACEGDTVTYGLTLCNYTGSAGTFDLTYTSLWPISGPPSVAADEGECVPFAVSVDIPCGGVSDTATVTAEGNGYSDSSTLTTSASAGGWVQIATEPNSGRMDNVLAAYDGFAWSITGYGADANVRKYDPVTNAWSVVGTPPSFGVNYARSGCQHGSKVYVYGDAATAGFTGLWSYDMATTAWAQVTPSGTPPAYSGIWAPAWVHDPDTGLCYMTGGATAPGTGNLTTAYVYDPVANAWLAALPNFTTVRDFHAAFIFSRPSDGHKLLCVVGGNSGGVGLTSTQCYDFAAGAWNVENADLGALPGDLWGMGYAQKVHQGTDPQLWLTAGVYMSAISTATWYYDVNGGAWNSGGNLVSAAVYRTSAVTLDNEVYKLGGSTGSFNYTGLADHHIQCAPCEQTMTCGQIVGVGRFDPYGRRIVKWRVWVVDQALQPLGEVAVTADLTWPTGGPVTRTRMSKNVNGVASFPWGSNAAGTWTIDVTNMVKAGYTFVDGPQCYAEGYFK